MIKKAAIATLFLIFCFSISLVSAGVVINEVMPKPTSTYEEWVELYNNDSSNVTLLNWVIGDTADNDTFSINISAHGFALILDDNLNCSSFNIANESCVEIPNIGNSLSDTDALYLYNNTPVLISNFSWATAQTNLSWQFYNNSWLNCTPTPGTVNNCTSSTSNPPANTTDDITIELEWNEDDIVNGEEFEITVNVENLESGEDYDIIVQILNEDDDIISETYGDHGEDEDNWETSKNYVLEVFSGGGDKDDDIKLRIDSDYSDFEGDATIIGKVRETGGSVKDEFEDDIEVLESEDNSDSDSDSSSSSSSSTSSRTSSTSSNRTSASSDIITLGAGTANSKKTSQNNNSTIYKSKNEYIKEYAPYAFGGLCIFLIALLLLDRTKGI